MSEDRAYSVSELSKLAGVSVRTLHHYDQIGLLTPHRRDNGYREYGYQHLIRLQQIIIYRELDFSLDDIGQLLNVDNYDLLSALESQKALLLERQNKTQSIINSIEVAMTNIRADKNVEIMFDGLPTEKLENWDKLTEDTYGISMTDVTKKVVGNLSEEEAQSLTEKGSALDLEYVKVIPLPVDSKTVQDLVEQYHSIWQKLVGLEGNIKLDYEKTLKAADRMLNDPISQEIYSFYHKDFSEHLGKALLHYAEVNLKDK